MPGTDPSEEFETHRKDAARPDEERPDWLVGAEEGAQAEAERDAPVAQTPLRLVKPAAEATGAGAPPARTEKPQAWKAAASSVPRLSHVEADDEDRPIVTQRPKEPVWAEPDVEDAAAHGLGSFVDDGADPGADPLDPAPARSAPAPVPVRPFAEPWWAVALDMVRTNRALQLGILAAVVAVAAWLMWPQSEPTVSIRAIREHPERYSGETVRVRGTVGDVYPVGGAHAFYLEQGGDTIVVFSRVRVPQRNDHVRLSGSVSMGYLDGVARPALFEIAE